MLSLVATPIGNLADITFRAIETLKQADVIAAEDTRHTLRLLQHYGISKPLVSYHEHNESRRTPALVAELRAGRHIALVTDAGMPAISDPGYRLVAACIAENLPVTVLPGASAVITAIAGSGMGGGRFHFGGYLPVKSGQRERELAAALARTEFSAYFESPHRLAKSLAVLAKLDPRRPLCVARELTKQHEEFRHGTAPGLAAHFEAHPPKGEIVLLISGPRRGAPAAESGLSPAVAASLR